MVETVCFLVITAFLALRERLLSALFIAPAYRRVIHVTDVKFGLDVKLNREN
jgi:hypothetical protein